MCFSKPNIPAPVPLQEQKQPDSINEFRRKRANGSPMASSTLLTGTGGLAPGASNTGSTTLLGG